LLKDTTLSPSGSVKPNSALKLHSLRPILAGMAKQPPEQTKPTRWEIFKIASKSVWIGSVEAPDEASAILKAAEEFKIDARRLYVRGDDAHPPQIQHPSPHRRP
jgi:hypothetical protein